MPRGDYTLAAVLITMLAPTISHAEDTEFVDIEFLEYLGSLESDDGNWTEVLKLPEFSDEHISDKDAEKEVDSDAL